MGGLIFSILIDSIFLIREYNTRHESSHISIEPHEKVQRLRSG